MPEMTPSVGKPMDRVDGRLKVTGGARYAAEYQLPNLAYAVMVTSTIPKGRIAEIITAEADSAPGVLLVMTPANAMRLPQDPGSPGGTQARPQLRRLSLLQDSTIYYDRQPISVVIAETFEQAAHAASLVKVRYQEDKPALDIEQEQKNAYAPRSVNGESADTNRGNVPQGLSSAAQKIAQTYTTPIENHNPMEPHATIAAWDGDKLTLYDATQGIFGAQRTVAKEFNLPPGNVRVISHFVGGGFGCKGSVWSHVVLAAMAARQVGRPVKLVLMRQQMFGMVGFRPRTRQQIALGASADGRLTAMQHDTLSQTSTFDEFVEPSGIATRILYDCPNTATSHRLVRLNMGTPTYMRAPGESSGTFAIETAMDELAYALKMDPVELRLHNYAETNPQDGKPWSSKSLRECYQAAGEKFGWSRRTPTPRSMRASDGRLLGWGMASATYPTRRSPSSAMARLLPDGTAYVQAGSQDIGTGTYTVMTQIAADALGLPPEHVRFELGDTLMPETPVSGGSQTAASTGSAVHEAGNAARAQAIQLAVADSMSPLYGLNAAEIDVQNGRMFRKSQPTQGETFTALIQRQKLPRIEAHVDAKPGAEQRQYAMHSFGGVFAEVAVDPGLGTVRLTRFVGAYGVGKILNAKTARSQLIGGVIYGVGMALLEQTVPDPRNGRVVNADLAEYHVPVNADVPDIDIIVVDENDPYVNPLGIKGIGEIGITGVAAAISNAVYHAAGIRVRDLPITLDKLL